ncbi:MAG TPA: glycosyltransferase family 4 protein, partial [Chthoniobacterales bacterium]
DQVFRKLPAEARTREMIFVGRLVSDKGADLLLEALALLESKPRLTIAGDGPERGRLEKQMATLQLQSQVDFVGNQSSDNLAKLLNQHEIMVVPSRWKEPFGIVALEAIACGCVLVGSAEGGLPEAIGPCGVTFPNNDARGLANALAELLGDPTRRDALRRGAASHLAQFTPRHVAKRYLEVMQSAP